MALTAKGITACFLGSAQLSAQVREDAWRGELAGGGSRQLPASCIARAVLPLPLPPPAPPASSSSLCLPSTEPVRPALVTLA